MKVGDLVKYTWIPGPADISFGIVVGFDHEAEGVLCCMEGQNLWFKSSQVQVINESR